MGAVVVRYQTTAEQADENERLVQAVFAELNEADPGGVRYATFRLEDNTFVHIAEVESDPNPLGQIAAFAEFQRNIGDRCEPGQTPNPQAATLVGAYGFLGELTD